MTKARTYGHTKSGKVIDEKMIESLAGEAESGYDVDQLIARRAKRGRPTLGSGPATIESVRLDPELKQDLQRRAEQEGVSLSEVIRNALRQYVKAS
ncbi:MAG TPA: CopG family transcriptional regulator [Acidimicrobiales bacterium]|nr:CopG family transcriptional regulator [Acidimicrobiales bacterium]